MAEFPRSMTRDLTKFPLPAAHLTFIDQRMTWKGQNNMVYPASQDQKINPMFCREYSPDPFSDGPASFCSHIS